MKRDLLILIKEASDTLPDLPNLDQYLKEVSNDLLNAASTLTTVRSRIDTDIHQHLDKAQVLVKVDMWLTFTSFTGWITYASSFTDSASMV